MRAALKAMGMSAPAIAMAMGSPVREVHYWPESGRSEYWQFSAATGWRIVGKGDGEEWPADTFSYKRWGALDKPETKGGRPSRIYI